MANGRVFVLSLRAALFPGASCADESLSLLLDVLRRLPPRFRSIPYEARSERCEKGKPETVLPFCEPSAAVAAASLKM